ncbi:S8 family serine peptidase [Streptomyces sp. NPDC058486]|uniref:S8 family serine peptidase n=1 Tax=unclassified Streptomyces TaxID=2593676 RepID=UPI003655AAFC
MRRRTRVAITRALVVAVAVGGAALAVPSGASGASAEPAPRPGRAQLDALRDGELYDQFIVKFRGTSPAGHQKAERAKALRETGAKLGVDAAELRPAAGAGVVFRTDRKLDEGGAEGLLRSLAARGDVEYVEPDIRMHATLTPNDTRYAEQWHYSERAAGLNAPTAWDRADGTGVTVAVLDTGGTAHPDLDGNTVAGYDFVSSAAEARDGNGRDNDPTDQGDWTAIGACGTDEHGNPEPSYASDSSWHGTHVAGTIAAVSDNRQGVAGVARNARIQHLRALGRCGGTTSDITDAIIWASGGSIQGIPDNPTPARVINMSLGGPGACGATYQNAINSAVSRGTTVVVAAGNENDAAVNHSPANCANVITVAAADRQGNRAGYSNYGASVDVAAPGGETDDKTLTYWLRVRSDETEQIANDTLRVDLVDSAGTRIRTLATHSNLNANTAYVRKKIELNRDLASRVGQDVSLRFTSTENGTLATSFLIDDVAISDGRTANVLSNGGFESGNTDWTASNGIIDNDRAAAARTGAWKAWLGGTATARTDTLSQTFRVTSLNEQNTILSTYNTGTTTPGAATYAFSQGTSMAAPHVAGVVALMRGENADLTPALMESLLKETVRPLAGTCTDGCGAGLVDAVEAVDAADGFQQLANRGFESGNTAWTASNGVIDNTTGTPGRTGAWKAWLGGHGSARTDTLSQRVTIPQAATRANLRFWLRVMSDETGTGAYDTLRVQVLDDSGAVLSTLATYSNQNRGTTWLRKNFDLSAYRGQSVTLRFTGQEDASLKTSFLVDDTSLSTS